GKIVSVTDVAGNTFNLTYSGKFLSSVSDPFGNRWHYSYDANGRMSQKTDPSGNTTSYVYDAATGKLMASTDPNGKVISISYDTADAITRVTKKDGGVWTHTYDQTLGAPLSVTDPYGGKTIYRGNPNIRATSRKSPCKYSDYFTLLSEVSSFSASLE
ncbi:MAG: hypothetical protein ACP5IL_17870, partial [Syntrophobacteraceae bacterium]